MQRLLTRLLASASAGLLGMCGPAQAGPIQTLLGLPDWMDLSVDYTTEPMGGMLGGLNPAATSWFQETVVGLSMSSGLNKEESTWQEIDHWQVNLELTNAAGDPNLNTELGSAFTLQTLVIPVGTWITEANISRNRGESWWDAQAGLMSMDPEFLVAPAYNNYINSTLNNTLNLLVVGLPINPFVAPGVKLGAHSENLGSIKYGYFYLNPETSIAASLGTDPEQPDVQGSLQALQWQINPLRKRKDLFEPIRVRNSRVTVARQLPLPLMQLGGYYATTKLLIEGAGEIGDGANRGLYASLTWPIELPVGLDNRIWLAGSLGLDPDNNPVPTFGAGGWLSQGVLPNRPLDVLALGLTRSSFSPTLTPGLTYEGVIELNYSIYFSDVVQVQPVMQWLINPSGTGEVPGVWAGGVQVNLNL